MKWSLQSVWDKAFEEAKWDAIKQRDYLYASELGTSHIDCFLKMKGVPYTNLPTSNARRKMEAGKVWESIVLFVLSRVGIIKAHQGKHDIQLAPNLLSVHGKLDMMAGGAIDIETAKEVNREAKFFMETLRMPSIYTDIAERMINEILAEAEGKEIILDKYILECKSVSAFVWDLIEMRGEPSPNHRLQTYHYMMGAKLETGKVIYINRDDCRIREMYVNTTQEIHDEYIDWLTPISTAWANDMLPQKEPLIIFNEANCKFYKNTMGVEWSRYLTQLYGYENPQAYRDDIGDKVTKANYSFKRLVEGKKITDSNTAAIRTIEEYFPNLEELIQLAQARGIPEELTPVIVE